MTQGLYTAVSGVRSNQTRMDVISNNVANVNTLGYKSTSANFATVFSKTITGGTTPNGLLGGTNPMQIGNGAQVAEIAANFSQGGTQFTGRNTDMMISGDGFFAVERIDSNTGNASTDFFLTRAGNFSLDSAGNLVTSAGNRIRGTSQMNGSVSDTLGRVQIPQNFIMAKHVDANGQTLGILHAPIGTSDAQIQAAYDARFGTVTVPGDFQLAPVEMRTFSIGIDGSVSATYSNGDTVTVRVDQSSINATDPSQTRRELIHIQQDGQTFAFNDVQNTDNNTAASGGGLPGPGQLMQFDAGQDSVWTGGVSNGSATFEAMQGMQMQLQTATVTNPPGLIYEGGNNFLIGANSGETSFGAPGDGSRGSLNVGALESSNVDIAGEFTNMVITQRGIEAASRVIRSQSEILQTIIQSV